jgi:hypothetical protein
VFPVDVVVLVAGCGVGGEGGGRVEDASAVVEGFNGGRAFRKTQFLYSVD